MAIMLKIYDAYCVNVLLRTIHEAKTHTKVKINKEECVSLPVEGDLTALRGTRDVNIAQATRRLENYIWYVHILFKWRILHLHIPH